jgi:hypothetical protein
MQLARCYHQLIHSSGFLSQFKLGAMIRKLPIGGLSRTLMFGASLERHGLEFGRGSSSRSGREVDPIVHDHATTLCQASHALRNAILVKNLHSGIYDSCTLRKKTREGADRAQA